MERPRCSNAACGKDAGSRCDECSPDGKLPFAEYFDTAHSAFIAAVEAWSGRGKWATKHCATHANRPLDLWCDACRVPVCDKCLSHGAHKEHTASPVSGVWRALQQDLRERAERLDAEVERGTERLVRLARLQNEAAQREGSVGAARRAMDAVEVLFAGKMRALRAELEAAAVSWHDRAAEEHAKLAQGIASVQTLVASMRATCSEVENPQRVAVEYEEQCRQREALLGVPLRSLVGCAVGVPPNTLAALRQAVADLAVLSDGVVSCGLCEEEVCEGSATVCESCKHGLCRSCAPCIACCVKAERDALPEAVRDRVVVPEKVPQYSLAVAACYGTIGEMWGGAGDNNGEALRLYNKALLIYEEKAPNSLDLAQTHHGCGSMLSSQGQYDEALDAFKKALPVFEQKAPNTVHLAKTYGHIGLVFHSQSKYDETLVWSNKALPIYEEKAPNSLDLADTYQRIGSAFLHVLKYDEALDAYNKALAIYEETASNSLRIAQTYHSIGLALYSRSKDEDGKALDWYHRALVIREERAPDSLHLAKTYFNIGLVLDNQSKDDEALDWYNKSLRIREQKAPNTVHLAKTFIRIARVLHSQRKYDEALVWSNKSLPIYEEKAPNSHDLADTYYYSGCAAANLSQYDKALDCFNKALPIYDQVANASAHASAYQAVGNALMRQQKYDGALDAFDKAVSILKKTETTNTPVLLQLANTYHSSGNVLHAQSKYEGTLIAYNMALAIYEQKAPNTLDLAWANYNIGLTLEKQRKYDEALVWYNKALPIFEQQAPNSLDLASTCDHIGFVFEKQGKHARARDWYNKAKLHRPSS